jgi:protein-disulfide isomerase
MPLGMHPWARMAAEAAGCAQLQSSEAFWSLHDRIFENQGAIMAENAKKKLGELAKGSNGVSAAAFQKCVDAGMSVGLVLKDMDLAGSFQVNGTPTVFINGHRVAGVGSAAKLREMIAEARKEAGLHPATPAALGTR